MIRSYGALVGVACIAGQVTAAGDPEHAIGERAPQLCESSKTQSQLDYQENIPVKLLSTFVPQKIPYNYFVEFSRIYEAFIAISNGMFLYLEHVLEIK